MLPLWEDLSPPSSNNLNFLAKYISFGIAKNVTRKAVINEYIIFKLEK